MQVVRARLLRVNVVRQHVRLDDDVLADLEVVHALAERGDDAGELVAEGDRRFLPGDRVRVAGRRAEDRALEVFVQVGAADAAPGDVYEHLAFACNRGVDFLDTDVLLAVVAHSAHVKLLSVEYPC